MLLQYSINRLVQPKKNSQEEDALGRPGGKADGYKLRAEGVNNVFPASMPVFA